MRESDRIGSALRSGLHSIRLNFHSSNRPDRVCPARITRICNSNVRRTHVTRALVVHFVCSFDGLIRLTLGAHTHRAHNDRIRQANEGCCYHNQPYTSLKFGWSTAVAIAARADQRRTPFGGCVRLVALQTGYTIVIAPIEQAFAYRLIAPYNGF